MLHPILLPPFPFIQPTGPSFLSPLSPSASPSREYHALLHCFYFRQSTHDGSGWLPPLAHPRAGMSPPVDGSSTLFVHRQTVPEASSTQSSALHRTAKIAMHEYG
jgi:hypothetical protein